MTRPATSLEQSARNIVSALKQAGFQALWAGGCVRDRLLGREPADIDIATDATPDQILTLFRKTRQVGAQFGVVLVRDHQHWIEVATFRRDVNYQDGRRPEQVVFTDAREDAARRDFTINGLFLDPLSGEVVDYVGGQDDLRARLIRAIGKPAERFAEDHLRMLRAPRFAARLGFAIEPGTATAIRAHAARLARITPERIRQELHKMLNHPNRARAFEMMAELDLLPYLWTSENLPTAARASAASEPPSEAPPGCIDMSTWSAARVKGTRDLLAALPSSADFALALAAMLHDRDPREAECICRALRCSNQETERVAWLLVHREQLLSFDQLPLPTARKLRAHPGFAALVDFGQALVKAHGKPSSGVEAAWRLSQQMTAAEATPLPFVTGADLLDRRVPQGPLFRTILEALYDAQLNEELADRPAALTRLEALLQSNPSH